MLLRAMPAIRARIAALFGGRDASAVPDLGERRATLARFQPDLDFRVVAGASHRVNYEAPAAVNRALREMLA